MGLLEMVLVEAGGMRRGHRVCMVYLVHPCLHKLGMILLMDREVVWLGMHDTGEQGRRVDHLGGICHVCRGCDVALRIFIFSIRLWSKGMDVWVVVIWYQMSISSKGWNMDWWVNVVE